MTKKLLFLFLVLGSTIVMAQNLTITTTVCSDASSVRMTGPWWSWSPIGGPEATNNGDGTWTFNFFEAPTSDMEYLLVVDGFMENLLAASINSGNWSCSPLTDSLSYANRQWLVGSGNVMNVFGTCGTCADFIAYGCTDSNAANFNPSATSDDGSCVFGTSLPVNFEGTGYDFTDFDGASSTIVSNPFSSDANPSGNVVEHVRNGGQFWAGTYLTVNPINFENSSVINIKVRTPVAGIPVRMKLEANTGEFVELDQNTSLEDEWEELSYDFSGQPSDLYSKIVLIFNMGTVGDGSANSTYYFDDIAFATGPILGCTDQEANNYNQYATQDDGSCTYGIISLNITVNPCMDVDSVRLTGPFWGWNDVEGPSATKNSDGTWTFAFEEAPAANMEYLFVVDGVREDMVAAGTASDDWSCTPVTDYFSYANRVWQVGSGDVTDVYYGSCSGCGNDFNIDEPINQSLVYPNPVANKFRLNTNVSSLFVYDIYGKLVKSVNNPTDEIDISSLSDGVYMIRLVDENSQNSIIKILKK